ncbi:TPA: O-antigen polysaccharide polymerase Wzy [Providencia alcalifaciens]|nr:O-antigen polysaccharide polymerase Wzy [Providencia alcalifaciens]
MNYITPKVTCFFQILIYTLLIPFFLLIYFIQYTEAAFIMPYFFLLIVISILLFNNISGIYINSTYSLFIISFLVFIGGRFIAYILDGSFELYRMDFFISYVLTEKEALNLMTYVILGIIFIDLGYKLFFVSGATFSNIKINHSWLMSFSLFALLLSPLFIIELLMNIKGAISGGYLSSKLWQASTYSLPLSSFAQTIFGIAFGYSMVSGYKKKYFLAIFIFTVIASLIIGARGPIITAIFLYLWARGNNGNKKINIIKIFSLFFLLLILVSYFIQIYSFRSNSQELEMNFIKFISEFFYSQGISLMVFDASMKITDYPILAYLQSIIPGSSAIASLFLPVEYYMTGFHHYMAKTLDSNLFNEGFGLDWTLLSDFYVFGAENIIGFSILAFLFGALFSLLQNSTKYDFWLILLYALFTRLIFLPRSTLSIIIPFIIYFIFFVYLIPKLKKER